MKFILLFICVYVQCGNSLYCYWNTGCPYRFLASKTPYGAVRSDIRDSIIKLTGCESVGIWGLVRHGKTSPGPESAAIMKDALAIRDNVISSYEKGNSSLCAQDVENLKQWKLDSKMFELTNQLTEEGFQDSQGLGTRLKQAFPKLLGKLDKENYTFRSAQGNWIEDSAKAFVNGLQDESLVIDKVREDYDVMIPYKNCAKYQSEVLDNPKTYGETKKYHESSEYLAMRDKVRRRVGVDYALTDSNITALYDWCRYIWSGADSKTSPWCALFTTEDLKVLEYAEDLEHYYKNGYGSPMNLQFGKIVLTDLFEQFQKAKEGTGKQIVTYFTDDTSIEMVYTALNLFKDGGPLNGIRKNPKIKWRNSKFSPYSSNLLAVLNRCNQQNDYNVVFYLNEEPLLIPICKDGVCTWREFEDKLKGFSSAKPDFC